MTEAPPGGESLAPSYVPDAAALCLRGVHRALSDLRRGTPVLLGAGEPLLLLAAETASGPGLAEFAARVRGEPSLLVAPMRAAALLRRPVEPSLPALALRLPAALLHTETLRGMADPTAEQMLPGVPEAVPAPAAAAAAIALAKLARLLPALIAAPAAPQALAAVARGELLQVEAKDVLAYPSRVASGLRRVAETRVPLEHAENARLMAFRAPDAGIEHLAILVGRPEAHEAPLARIHSECFTGDLLGSLRCDCGPQLRGAIRRMGEEGDGVLLYLAQEGRGIGLVNKLRAYTLQDRGLDTLDANRALGWGADERNFLVAATMLAELGIARVRLLTNNPDKVTALAACGVEVTVREAHSFAPNGVNDRYLATKAERFGHLFE